MGICSAQVRSCSDDLTALEVRGRKAEELRALASSCLEALRSVYGELPSPAAAPAAVIDLTEEEEEPAKTVEEEVTPLESEGACVDEAEDDTEPMDVDHMADEAEQDVEPPVEEKGTEEAEHEQERPVYPEEEQDAAPPVAQDGTIEAEQNAEPQPVVENGTEEAANTTVEALQVVHKAPLTQEQESEALASPTAVEPQAEEEPEPEEPSATVGEPPAEQSGKEATPVKCLSNKVEPTVEERESPTSTPEKAGVGAPAAIPTAEAAAISEEATTVPEEAKVEADAVQTPPAYTVVEEEEESEARAPATHSEIKKLHSEKELLQHALSEYESTVAALQDQLSEKAAGKKQEVKLLSATED